MDHRSKRRRVKDLTDPSTLDRFEHPKLIFFSQEVSHFSKLLGSRRAVNVAAGVSTIEQ